MRASLHFSAVVKNCIPFPLATICAMLRILCANLIPMAHVIGIARSSLACSRVTLGVSAILAAATSSSRICRMVCAASSSASVDERSSGVGGMLWVRSCAGPASVVLSVAESHMMPATRSAIGSEVLK